MNNFELISIVVISHKSYDDLLLYFNSFSKHHSLNEVSFLVLETSGDKRTKDIAVHLSHKFDITVIYIPNNGYSFACNYGYKNSKDSKIIVFSNPDIVFNCEIISAIRNTFNENNYGTILQKLPTGEIKTFDLFPNYKNFFTELFKVHKLINRFKIYNPKYTYIVGAFMIFGRNVIESNGLFDENFFLYYEETDYYFRLRNNKNVKVIDEQSIIHNVSTSIDVNINNKVDVSLKSLLYYCKKHHCEYYLNSLLKFYKVFSFHSNFQSHYLSLKKLIEVNSNKN